MEANIGRRLTHAKGIVIAVIIPSGALILLVGQSEQITFEVPTVAGLARKRRAAGRTIWGRHRIAVRQSPFGAVVGRGHAIGGLKMPLEHLQPLAVFKANDMAGED
jgi:hypothetical protein